MGKSLADHLNPLRRMNPKTRTEDAHSWVDSDLRNTRDALGWGDDGQTNEDRRLAAEGSGYRAPQRHYGGNREYNTPSTYSRPNRDTDYSRPARPGVAAGGGVPSRMGPPMGGGGGGGYSGPVRYGDANVRSNPANSAMVQGITGGRAATGRGMPGAQVGQQQRIIEMLRGRM